MEYGGLLKSKLKIMPLRIRILEKKHTCKKIYSTYSMKISKSHDVFKIAFKVAPGGHLALYYSSTIKLKNNTSV